MGQESLLLNLLGFKAVAVLAYLAQSLLVYAILKRRAPRHAVAGVLFFAWNPLLLYEVAVNGHNDVTMMAFALLGVLMWQLERPYLMVAALTMSFLVKIPTLPLLPLFLLAAARKRETWRAFWVTLMAGGSLAVMLVLLAYFSLPSPLDALTNLSGRSDLFTHSLPTIVKLVLRLAGREEAAATAFARTAALLALAAWFLVQVYRTWRVPDAVLQHVFDLVAFLLLLVTPWFQPWYVTWLLSLAALAPRPGARSLAALFSGTVMIAYVVYGFAWFWFAHQANWANCLGINLAAVTTTFVLPWAYVIWRWAGLRRRKN